MRYLVSIALVALVFLSCEKKESQAEKDDEIIRNYLDENDITAEKHYSGLYYTITRAGSGGHPNLYSIVDVLYKGKLLNGQIFDQTQGGRSVSFPLSDLIVGWQIGIPMLQKGGKGTFYVPSGLGYGSRELGSIPANSVLIFDIELVAYR